MKNDPNKGKETPQSISERAPRPFSAPLCSLLRLGRLKLIVTSHKCILHAYMYTIVIDASGKPGSNLLTLVWQWLGDYDECQSIGPQEAHYCLFESAYANISVLPQNNTPSAIKKVG